MKRLLSLLLALVLLVSAVPVAIAEGEKVPLVYQDGNFTTDTKTYMAQLIDTLNGQYPDSCSQNYETEITDENHDSKSLDMYTVRFGGLSGFTFKTTVNFVNARSDKKYAKYDKDDTYDQVVTLMVHDTRLKEQDGFLKAAIICQILMADQSIKDAEEAAELCDEIIKADGKQIKRGTIEYAYTDTVTYLTLHTAMFSIREYQAYNS